MSDFFFVTTQSNNAINAMQPPLPDAADAAAEAEAPARVTSLMTIQSLTNFTGVSTVVTALWRLFQSLGDWSWVDSRLLPFGMCLGFGLLSWVASIWDNGASSMKLRDKILGLVIALVNSCIVAAAVLGLNEAIDLSAD